MCRALAKVKRKLRSMLRRSGDFRFSIFDCRLLKTGSRRFRAGGEASDTIANRKSQIVNHTDVPLFLFSFAVVGFLAAMSVFLTAVYHLAVLPIRCLRLFLRYAFLWILTSALIAGVLATGVFLNSPTGDTGAKEIVLERGMMAGEVGRMLKRERIVRNARFFSILARVTGLEKRIEAGEHTLSGAHSTLSVLNKLRSGRYPAKNVTVPEGWTRYQIAGLFREHLDADSLRFLSFAEDPAVCRGLGVDASSLEGYLFPDTYNFFVPTDERRIIERMVDRFHQVFADSLAERAKEFGWSIRQAVTLASIVEREAQVVEERQIIAGVFHRRLKLGRALESCATVKYALGKHKGRLVQADLNVASPYNTYLHRGLPPGPIGNPGIASILAALYPADVDYLYFVARGDGTHIFTRTNREHARAKYRVRREKREE